MSQRSKAKETSITSEVYTRALFAKNENQPANLYE